MTFALTTYDIEEVPKVIHVKVEVSFRRDQ